MKYIRDEEFIRGKAPMTKEEIRILSISKLNLEKDFKVLDVGAGTGSVSVQMSKVCYEGHITAIEKDIEAIDLIEKNKEKFNAHNISIVEGEALEVENNINEKFDAVFIGGSGGDIESIIKRYGEKLKLQKNMVLNFITIDNVYRAMHTLKNLEYDVDLIQVSVNRGKGKSCMLVANNPIFILTAVKKY
ncbi:putative cobalt-precorrin-6B C(15)-methyltransferase (decarboxylating) [Clostridium pasteurianum DSM 525 = ATCC 6013]|uniref:Precorrin-6Y C5,15-methyltransferase (Decarboxylating), CbiT subunit n=1 Tax=Clostridium pasteurianum DSM 525 = ATCC 6013 TaxID=1262449 RepID=A0A0H3J1S4_CLOPA|nr:precorrin-6Y C5,15-methyltransferase (decarboxylating) subunit CbiT [Clostridium pasteurianum]AJA47364.1 putative cobalt-precorrin-6B C(15)-methyltransferase (decarboxylating) [Clostridium pasteurianum DSM 525 = ATCC 6013]AJA51352.1 putative cobalt-precorrin-6B C(15)-methyltransferase (decarboxylating) [Clostridium pasteurianum DSM 525 = ATCC 6013]AOZ74695.1 SAM-dependent methyltransferase [Clostridium pasteurianum DSM 525 = ATCC 6013]AOZ78491.1 SAM-dependent methyltransferase [Clostridium p